MEQRVNQQVLSVEGSVATVKLFAYDRKDVCRGDSTVKMPLRSLPLQDYIATWIKLGRTEKDLKAAIATQFKVETRAKIGRKVSRNGRTAQV